jgi:hypothetical protein
MGILDWGGARSRKGFFKTPGMTVAFCEEFILFACYFNISFICNFMFYCCHFFLSGFLFFVLLLIIEGLLNG